MERLLSSKSEKQSIYEIFRACRLCGAGGGYKMPIMQSIPLDVEEDVELRLKIRECVQIEVNQNDKMPPLICELCVDKINDFYEFLEMCRQTNKRTRLRLGLPPQTLPQGAPDAGDCILGVTEPVYVNEDSNDTPLSKQKLNIQTNKKIQPAPVKRKPSPEPNVVVTRRSAVKADVKKVQHENSVTRTLRESQPFHPKKELRKRPRMPSPPPRRATRQHPEEDKEDSINLSRLKIKEQQQNKRPSTSKDPPKSILKVKTEDSLLKPRELGKRSRERELQKNPVKRVKIAIKPAPPPPVKIERRKAPTPPPRKAPVVEEKHKCKICDALYVKAASLHTHMRSHSPNYTSARLACNACREWFSSSEESAIHHRWHRISNTPYHCSLCTADFKLHNAYNEHFEKKSCIPSTEVPDIKCESCWAYFPSQNWIDHHKCPGEDGRPGGKCPKCLRTYATCRTLRKHEESCRGKKKDGVTVSPEVRARLRNLEIRFSRCDDVLDRATKDDGHYDVANVPEDYGLVKDLVYPYKSCVGGIRIKMEPETDFDEMVNIKDEFLDLDEAFVHWDSDDGDNSDIEEVEPNVVANPFATSQKRRRVNTLARLSIRTIFSNKFLGKVPKRKRKLKIENVKSENEFDSFLNIQSSDKCMKNEINEIIYGLSNENDNDYSKVVDTTERTEKALLVNSIKDDSAERSEGDVDMSVQTNKCIDSLNKTQVEFLQKEVIHEKDSESSGQSMVNIDKIVDETPKEDEIESKNVESNPKNVESERLTDLGTKYNEIIDTNSENVSSGEIVSFTLQSEAKNIDGDVDLNPNIREESESIKSQQIEDFDRTNNKEITLENNGKSFECEQKNGGDVSNVINESVVRLEENTSALPNKRGTSEETNTASSENKEETMLNGNSKNESGKNSDGDFGCVSDSELDDTKLLEALDEQIDEIGKYSKNVPENKQDASIQEENFKDNRISVEGHIDNSKKDLKDVSQKSQEFSKDLVENENQSKGEVETSIEENLEDSEKEVIFNSAEKLENPIENCKENSEVSNAKLDEYLRDQLESSEVDLQKISTKTTDTEVNTVKNLDVNINNSKQDLEKHTLLEDKSLDEQINSKEEDNQEISEERENFLLEDKSSEEKINIADIIQERPNRSMDLDNISDDEFDFDC